MLHIRPDSRSFTSFYFFAIGAYWSGQARTSRVGPIAQVLVWNDSPVQRDIAELILPSQLAGREAATAVPIIDQVGRRKQRRNLAGPSAKRSILDDRGSYLNPSHVQDAPGRAQASRGPLLNQVEEPAYQARTSTCASPAPCGSSRNWPPDLPD